MGINLARLRTRVARIWSRVYGGLSRASPKSKLGAIINLAQPIINLAAPGAPSPPSDDDARRLQNTLNRAAAERLTARAEKLGDGGASRHYAAAVERESAALASGAFEKHWTIIVEAERLARRLDLPLAVFCKSGKDRTGQRTNQISRCF